MLTPVRVLKAWTHGPAMGGVLLEDLIHGLDLHVPPLVIRQAVVRTVAVLTVDKMIVGWLGDAGYFHLALLAVVQCLAIFK